MLKNEHGFLKMSTKIGGKMDEKEFEFYLKEVAPSQKEFRSEAAKKGEKRNPQARALGLRLSRLLSII